MVPYLFDAIWMRLPGTANAVEDTDDDSTRLIPETLALLARMHDLSADELHTLTRNLETLAQCAEDRAERSGEFDTL